MKLWLISQTAQDGYDTFDSAVVAAESDAEAKTIHPSRVRWEHEDLSPEIRDRLLASEWNSDTWASSPDQVSAKLIGSAEDGMAEGVIVASFNAG